jgi:hypothetical protein
MLHYIGKSNILLKKILNSFTDYPVILIYKETNFVAYNLVKWATLCNWEEPIFILFEPIFCLAPHDKDGSSVCLL